MRARRLTVVHGSRATSARAPRGERSLSLVELLRALPARACDGDASTTTRWTSAWCRRARRSTARRSRGRRTAGRRPRRPAARALARSHPSATRAPRGRHSARGATPVAVPMPPAGVEQHAPLPGLAASRPRVLAHVDFELLAVARLHVRLEARSESPFVSVRTIVAPVLGLTAASTLSLVSPVSAVSPRRGRRVAAPCPSAAALVGLRPPSPRTTQSIHDLQRPALGLDVRVDGRSVGPAGLSPQDGRARDLLQRGGLDLGATSLDSASRCWGLRSAGWSPTDVVLSAAPAMAAPPRPSASRAATVTADLRIVC